MPTAGYNIVLLANLGIIAISVAVVFFVYRSQRNFEKNVEYGFDALAELRQASAHVGPKKYPKITDPVSAYASIHHRAQLIRDNKLHGAIAQILRSLYDRDVFLEKLRVRIQRLTEDITGKAGATKGLKFSLRYLIDATRAMVPANAKRSRFTETPRLLANPLSDTAAHELVLACEQYLAEGWSETRDLEAACGLLEIIMTRSTYGDQGVYASYLRHEEDLSQRKAFVEHFATPLNAPGGVNWTYAPAEAIRQRVWEYYKRNKYSLFREAVRGKAVDPLVHTTWFFMRHVSEILRRRPRYEDPKTELNAVRQIGLAYEALMAAVEKTMLYEAPRSTLYLAMNDFLCAIWDSAGRERKHGRKRVGYLLRSVIARRIPHQRPSRFTNGSERASELLLESSIPISKVCLHDAAKCQEIKKFLSDPKVISGDQRDEGRIEEALGGFWDSYSFGIRGNLKTVAAALCHIDETVPAETYSRVAAIAKGGMVFGSWISLAMNKPLTPMPLNELI